MFKIIKLAITFFAFFQIVGCGAGANGILFEEYKKSLSMKSDEATIIVYRENQAGGFGIPIYLDFEKVGILLPRGYLALKVSALEEHVLNTKEGSQAVDAIRTTVFLEPNTIEYLRWDLFLSPIPLVSSTSKLVKVEKGVAIHDLNALRNSIE